MSTASPIVWTQQHRFFWTGRSDGRPVGIIERGARFTFTDAAGSEHHGFRTLEAAQAAAAELICDPLP